MKTKLILLLIIFSISLSAQVQKYHLAYVRTSEYDAGDYRGLNKFHEINAYIYVSKTAIDLVFDEGLTIHYRITSLSTEQERIVYNCKVNDLDIQIVELKNKPKHGDSMPSDGVFQIYYNFTTDHFINVKRYLTSEK